MKHEPLILSEIKLIPGSLLRRGMSVEELLNIASGLEATYHTPGSGVFSVHKKKNASGVYYEKELSYSIPGMLTMDEMEGLLEISAVVLQTVGGRSLVFYQHDYFMNTSLRFSFSSTGEKTVIKTSINSLFPI